MSELSNGVAMDVTQFSCLRGFHSQVSNEVVSSARLRRTPRARRIAR